jgi:5-methyltetrahydrofolate--homocysteine methyltransferase
MSHLSFQDRVAQGVVVFDGALGTAIHAYDLPLEAYNGLENCGEILVDTRPEIIEEIHGGYYAVGSDIVETNTFGASKLTLGEFDLQDRTYELNVKAAQIARKAAQTHHTPDKPRYVCGSLGPGTKLVSLRQTSYDTLVDSYAEQVRGLLDGGVDVLLIETCQDILQVKSAIQACRVAFDKTGKVVPIMVQVTVETTGTMLVGTDIAAAVTAIEAFPEVMSIGMNCATGPQEMDEHIRYLSRNTTRMISCQPNAGLPQVVDGKAHFPLTPDELARWLKTFVEEEGVRIVGGCCGTTPAHIEAIAKAVADAKPAERSPEPEAAASSLYQAVPYRQDNSFLIVGERCNTNGSRKFKRLLAEGDIEGLVETALEQVPESHVLDVCVDYVGREGAPDMEWVVTRFANDVTLPLMLDSTQIDVLETGLKLAGGKCIINSVNLEDGEEKLATIAGLCRQYGAAVVTLTIDEDPDEAMAKTADRKLSIAQRLHDLLVNRHGLRSEDIFFDCLTFPITTGNPTDRRLGLETLDGIEQIMKALPKCQSILGLSNISFGLEPAARAVLNSVFLHEARQRGLTAAIVHASKILPRNEIADERWNGALDLIYDRDEEALERYIGLFEAGEKVGSSIAIEELPIEQRLKQRIISGKKQGIGDDLDEARQTYKPLEIINTFLLDGMKVVGELFGSGQMQLPFVLKSAETMKAAVAHLEPYMEKVAGESNGKIILATVRGDVHDIGKNLVDIIISNNGYDVVNLGIKQPISNVITAFREHNANAIGLSGLLVKSTLIMRDDLGVLNDSGIDVPVILGGAALTRKYVEGELREIYHGPLYYAKDAFEGLNLMRQITEGSAVEAPAATATTSASQEGGIASAVEAKTTQKGVEQVGEEAEQRLGLREVADSDEETGDLVDAPQRVSNIGHEQPVPTPPFWGSRVLSDIPVKAPLGFMNETMLFQVQWGFRKKGRSAEAFKQHIDSEVRPIYRQLVQRCENEQILQPAAVYGYWPCNADGDSLVIYEPPAEQGGAAIDIQSADFERRELARFGFPRQSKAPHWCLADFWRPVADGVVDVVAFHIVTAGQKVSEVAREWFSNNEFQNYLFLHGLGVETAEAMAEYLHKQVRMELGIADQDQREIRKLFQQGYQGSRYSFGYPACPNLEDQVTLMKLLRPERIGIELSEEYQLHPEQSTSAIIAYHPQARYFNVR